MHMPLCGHMLLFLPGEYLALEGLVPKGVLPCTALAGRKECSGRSASSPTHYGWPPFLAVLLGVWW